VPYSTLEGKGQLTQNVIVVPKAYGIPQDEVIGESSDRSCKDYMET
jgi:hypothetical protein